MGASQHVSFMIVGALVFLKISARALPFIKHSKAVRRGTAWMTGISGTDPPTSSIEDPSLSTTSTFRIVALHGSEGTAESFIRTLEPWKEAIESALRLTDTDVDDDESIGGPNDSNAPTAGRRVTIEALQAPVPKGPGYSWWSLPLGVRSFTAEEYPEFEQSAALVTGALLGSAPQAEGAFDLVVAHSQGAILVTALLGTGILPPTLSPGLDSSGQQRRQRHPRCGYILNGVAWPNPFTNELETWTSSTTSSIGEGTAERTPRILLLVGERDRINPPDQADRVEWALREAGCLVSRIDHHGGHAVPTSQADDTMQRVIQWIQEAAS